MNGLVAINHQKASADRLGNYSPRRGDSAARRMMDRRAISRTMSCVHSDPIDRDAPSLCMARTEIRDGYLLFAHLSRAIFVKRAARRSARTPRQPERGNKNETYDVSRFSRGVCRGLRNSAAISSHVRSSRSRRSRGRHRSDRSRRSARSNRSCRPTGLCHERPAW